MKKTIALFVALILAFSCLTLVSCGGDEESSSKVESSLASETISEELSASAEEKSNEASDPSSVEVSEEASSESSEEKSEESEESEVVSEEASEESSEEKSEESEETDRSEEPEKSEEVSEDKPADISQSKAYQLLTQIDKSKGAYLKTTVEQGTVKIVVELGVLGDNSFSKNGMIMGNTSNSTTEIIKDGKVYKLIEATKAYTVAENTSEKDAFTAYIDNLLSAATYEKTVTEEIEGVSYTVDFFKNTSDQSEIKIYVSSENKVEYLLVGGMLSKVEMSETLPEGCFDIPEDYTLSPAA